MPDPGEGKRGGASSGHVRPLLQGVQGSKCGHCRAGSDLGVAKQRVSGTEKSKEEGSERGELEKDFLTLSWIIFEPRF